LGGVYHKGINIEMRIHATRLSSKFKRQLYNEVSKVNEWGFTPYSLDKISKRGISVETLGKAVVKGRLIEYHTKGDTRRVLLRCEDGTCAVVDLDEQAIITAYKNHADFDHPNLDRTKYLFGASL